MPIRPSPLALPLLLSSAPWLLLACQGAPDAASARLVRSGQGWRTSFPLSGVQAEIDANGLHMSPHGGGAGLSLRLDAWGRPDALAPLGAALPVAGGDGRVEADHGGLTEWWSLGASGGEAVEHGWTVPARPAGAGPMRFALRVTGGAGGLDDGYDGTLAGRVDDAGASWTDETGRRWSYTHLAAYDAAGVTLPARFVSEGGAVYIDVEDGGAAWPVTIDPLLSTAEVTVDGETPYANFGSSIADVGDFNGDGNDETVVSAWHYNNYAGRVYFNWGIAGGFAWNRPDLLDPDEGSSTPAFFSTVAAAGDVNSDGYDDFIVGGDGYNQSTGRVWLYMGVDAPPSTTTPVTMDGETVFTFFGHSVAGLGDINGDGYADIAVGAYGYNSYTGRVYVYLGSAEGLVTPAAQTLDGAATFDSFGRDVAAAGDLNADGYADLVVGAPNSAKAFGRVHVYLGSADGLVEGPTRTGAEATDSFGSTLAGVGDLDGDGFDDLMVGSPGDNAYTGRIFVYRGGADGLDVEPPDMAEGNGFGATLGTTIAPLGDIDADGYTEVLVGAPGTDDYRGQALLYTGRAYGLDTDPITTLEGEATGDYFGLAMAGLGDVDGDGYQDAMVGAPYSVRLTGRAYVYRGYPPADEDLDGYDETLDCDDTNAAAYPGAPETPANGVDEDCDGGELCYVDADVDAYRPDGTGTLASEDADCTDPGEAGVNTPPGDCDDNDATVHPGAEDIAGDGIDQDCDGKDMTETPDKKVDPKDPGGCGCAAGGGDRTGLLLGGVAAMFMIRRRRGAPVERHAVAPASTILR